MIFIKLIQNIIRLDSDHSIDLVLVIELNSLVDRIDGEGVEFLFLVKKYMVIQERISLIY